MAPPDYAPQLATLVKEAPAGPGWLHEIKYDGYRIGGRIRNGRATLISRNGKDWTAAFPAIASALAALPADEALIDGEVAVLLPNGRTSFQLLQNHASGGAAAGALIYFAFDLLRLDGERLHSKPLLERKQRLEALLKRSKNPHLKYAGHIAGNGPDFFRQACRLGLEGIISKRATEPHRPGRHGDWLKTKCVQRQEFVVGGFTDPEGTRAGIGALLIGHYLDGRFVFSGKVGTGFTHKVAVDLRRQLDRLEQRSCPFDPAPEGALGRNAHWVKPTLVCEVVFTEWTAEGKIRHPSFQGLRRDKSPDEVVRERPPARRRGRSRSST